MTYREYKLLRVIKEITELKRITSAVEIKPDAIVFVWVSDLEAKTKFSAVKLNPILKQLSTYGFIVDLYNAEEDKFYQISITNTGLNAVTGYKKGIVFDFLRKWIPQILMAILIVFATVFFTKVFD